MVTPTHNPKVSQKLEPQNYKKKTKKGLEGWWQNQKPEITQFIYHHQKQNPGHKMRKTSLEENQSRKQSAL